MADPARSHQQQQQDKERQNPGLVQFAMPPPKGQLKNAILAGHYFVLMDHNGWQKVIRAVPDKLTLNKSLINLEQVLGHPFGTVFEVTDRNTGDLQVVQDPRELLTKDFLEDCGIEDDEERNEKDNRDIVVNEHTAQKLQADDIEMMKQAVGGSKEIIEALKANSSTFDQRTKFSQEKWIKKKMAKYQCTFEARQPTAFNLCEVLFATAEHKICNLRPDALGLLLHMANVNSQSRCLIVDGTRGLLTGALVERCVSQVLQVQFTGEDQAQHVNPNTEILNMFNFTPHSLFRVARIHASLLEQDRNKYDSDDEDEQNEKMRNSFMNGLQSAYKKSYNSMIMVQDEFAPREVYDRIEYLLQPSACFAVFHQYAQPLVEMQDHLIKTKKAVNVRLEELWTRESQVLPMRTHPMMSMHGSSGFILSGVKVD